MDERVDTLTIGAVVTLKGREEKIMVVGNQIIRRELNSELKYDYAATNYPKGIILDEEFKYFNDKDIDHIYSLGYQTKLSDINKRKLRKQIGENNE